MLVLTHSEKRCFRCKHLKKLDEFGIDNSEPDRLTKLCKECKALTNREYYRRKRAEVKAASNRRRAQKTQCREDFTAAEWQLLCEKFGQRCAACGEARLLTADHVIPISLGGNNSISNIQPLCFDCNIRKCLQIIDYRQRPTTGQVFKLAWCLVAETEVGKEKEKEVGN